jgi:hypothetical protein
MGIAHSITAASSAQAVMKSDCKSKSLGGYPLIAHSVLIATTAPADIANSAMAEIIPELPLMSPTVGLTCSSAIRRAIDSLVSP